MQAAEKASEEEVSSNQSKETTIRPLSEAVAKEMAELEEEGDGVDVTASSGYVFSGWSLGAKASRTAGKIGKQEKEEQEEEDDDEDSEGELVMPVQPTFGGKMQYYSSNLTETCKFHAH